MDAGPSADDEAVRAVLLENVLADREAGRVRTVAAYQELFPEHCELVAAVLAELEIAASPAPMSAIAGLEAGPRSRGAPQDLGAIGAYRLLRELGRGGQGVVYLALDTRLQRRVALKVLPCAGPHAEELARRFQREAEIASRLDHPGICTIHEAGAAGGVLFIAMRHVEGETLAAWIAAAGGTRGGDGGETPSAAWRRELAATLALFEKCAAALHHAHEAGVVHRDVKPGNVLIDRCGEPVLLDFGLAREVDDLTGVTRTGDLFGTPAYMAPEQLAGGRSALDRRTDVYSLGVCLYEAVTGRRPFDAPTRERLFQEILMREPPDPRHSRRGFSADLKVVLETALAKEPDRRYQSALDLAEDLRRVRCREPIRARPVPWSGRVLRWARRSPARAALVLVLAVAAPALAWLGGYLVANRGELETGRQVILRSRLDRALDRGFTALLWNDTAAGPAFREALALDATSLEATVGTVLDLLQALRLQPLRPGAALGADGAGRIDEALAFLDRQERRIGRHPDLLRARLRCLEYLGEDEGIRELQLEIESHRSALGAVIDASRHWPVFIAPPPNVRAAEELYRLASLAIDLAPRPQIFHYHLRGVAASYLGKMQEAEHLADLLLERWPDDTEAMLHAGSLTAGSSRGRELLEEVIRREPDHAGAWAFCGIATLVSDPDRTIEHLRRAMEIGGPDRFVLPRLGIALLTSERPAEALEVFEEAVRRGSEAPEDLVMRGLARDALGDLDGAEADFRASLGLREGYAGGDWFLGRLLAEHGRIEEALPHLRRALDSDDANGLLWRLLGDALELAGREAEARVVWEAATRRLPDDFRTWNWLAWHLVDPGADPGRWSADLAVVAAERATSLSPRETWWVLDTLGTALYRRGEHERAVDALRRAVALQEERGSVRAGDLAILAAASAALGRPDEAALALGRARQELAAFSEARARRAAADRRSFPWNVRLRSGADERSAAAAIAEADAALAAAACGEDPGR